MTRKPTLYDCPSTSTRDRKPIRGAVAAVTIHEAWLPQLEGATNWAPAIVKGEPTQPGPYTHDLTIREVRRERTPYVLINAESSDAGSYEYADAIASTARVIRDTTDAGFGVYNHFGWSSDDAMERWHNMRSSYLSRRVYPKHVVVRGHWDGEDIRLLADRINREIDAVRRVEPWAPIAVLLCEWDYVRTALRTKETHAVKKSLLRAGHDVIWWYQPALVRPK